ncbi:MAG: sigma-70 family RNA polymerase sigma factor [Sedimentisphaerales bacterium]|nr:sigma-70 family RNA polymerase sigma factor [Sedimentisphaerales bacterium]
MVYRDQTSMGGTGGVFLTTHWSLIEDSKSDADRSRALVGLMLDRYWKPVYFYLRRKGYDNEEAKDLTQGFFHEIVLNRGLIQRADPSQGRFRSFLLHALEHYLLDERHKQTAQKRIPKDKLVPLDTIASPVLPPVHPDMTAEESYNYGWMSALLDRVLSDVEAKCREQEMTIHWNIFNDRIVQPILQQESPPSLEAICEKYGIADRKKASNMMITVKRCFQAVLQEHVRNTVISDDQTREELQEMMQFFPKSAQPLE